MALAVDGGILDISLHVLPSISLSLTLSHLIVSVQEAAQTKFHGRCELATVSGSEHTSFALGELLCPTCFPFLYRTTLLLPPFVPLREYVIRVPFAWHAAVALPATTGSHVSATHIRAKEARARKRRFIDGNWGGTRLRGLCLFAYVGKENGAVGEKRWEDEGAASLLVESGSPPFSCTHSLCFSSDADAGKVRLVLSCP
jgi:hypothetical protein